jgi:hypothetical protein
VTGPETGQAATTAELSPLVLAIAKLVLLAFTALALSGVQLIILFVLEDGPARYAVVAGSIAVSVLFAWALGLWRAYWSVRVFAALVCVAVTSWPFAVLVVFSACYFGPCRFV